MKPFSFSLSLSLSVSVCLSLSHTHTLSTRCPPLPRPFRYLIYYFPSEDADIHQDISNVVAPHNKVGALTLEWIPLAPGDEDGDNEAPDDELPEIQDPNELIGKPWTYKLKISGAKDLDQMAEQCYCQYRFLETTFTTENVESNSSNPAFEYECVHHVDQVTKEFLKFLQQPFHVSVFIKPYISNPPSDSLNTENPVIIGALSPDGAAAANADPMTRLKVENARLKSQNAQLRQENAELKKMLSSGSKAKGKIPAAKKLDQKVNGGEAKKAPAKKAPAKKAPRRRPPRRRRVAWRCKIIKREDKEGGRVGGFAVDGGGLCCLLSVVCGRRGACEDLHEESEQEQYDDIRA